MSELGNCGHCRDLVVFQTIRKVLSKCPRCGLFLSVMTMMNRISRLDRVMVICAECAEEEETKGPVSRPWIRRDLFDAALVHRVTNRLTGG